MEKHIEFRNEWGAPMATLSDDLQKPVKIYEGNIFKTKDEKGRNSLYSIENVAANDVECEVTVREIRPQGYKSLLLGALLVGSWFLVKYAFGALGL